MTHNEHVNELANVSWESTSPVILIANYIKALYDNGHITAMTYDVMSDRIEKE